MHVMRFLLNSNRSKFRSDSRLTAVTAADADPQVRRNARRYLTGLAVSVLGSNAMSLAAGIWVKSLTGSSSEAAVVSVCIYAPSLAGPLAGLVADRARRRPFLARLNLLSALLVLPMLAVRGPGQVWIIFACMAWYGIHLTVSDPAENALFAVMLPADVRRRLNGWQLGLQEAGRLVAPLAGAGLFTLAGGGVVAAADAATFVVAAAMISRIRLQEAPPQPAPARRAAALMAGFGHIGRTAQLRRVLIPASVVMGLSAVLGAAQYSLVQAVGEPPAFLGVLSACLGAGSIVASLLSGPLLSRFGEQWLLVGGLVNFAVGNALRGCGVLTLAIAGSAVLGFALPWVFLALLSQAQRLTPAGLQGRVSAAVTLVFFGPQAPLQAAGALAIGHVTYQQLYLAGAAAAVVCAAAALEAGCRERPEPSTTAAADESVT